MYRLLGCLTEQHDPRLLMLAALVCALSSGLGMWLSGGLSPDNRPRRQRNIVLLAGASTAIGIWSTHFVAMLAYDAGLPVTYDVGLTILSLLIALAAATGGFALASSQHRYAFAAGGGVIGLGIAAMHFAGMHSVVVNARASWDEPVVAASLAVSVILASAALYARANLTGLPRLLTASTLLVLAICGMHFTAMTAVTFVPDLTVAASDAWVPPLALGFIVAAATAVLLLAGLLAALFDRFTIARSVGIIGFVIMATLVTVIAIALFTIDQVRIGGHNFQRITASKDLVADVLPPPAFIVEAYLEARIAAADPDNIAYHARRLEGLRRGYEERHAYWSKSSLVPENTRQILVNASDAHVRRFWAEVDWSFLPAVASRNSVDIATSLYRLDEHYLAHRAVIEGLVKTADKEAEQLTTTLSQRSSLLEMLVLVTVGVLLLAVLAAILGTRALVVQPVLGTAQYLDNLRHGRLDAAVPYVVRRDEIGVMARAIDMLRLEALDKQRLESEAADARHTRDKERAAEALRLRMANESITGLNGRLTETVTQLERAQDENLRKGRLAQLGQLTATVAHEIRNPLGAIKTAAYLVDRKTKGRELGIDGPMQRISNGIQRCDAIITELLDFTRAKSLSATTQNVDAWVAGVVDEERRSVPNSVVIDIRAGLGAEAASFDASRMRRVLINLLSNAAEAMVGKPGQPAESPTADPRITITTQLIGGNIEMVVADNGPGISPENLERIREPLFTTKSFGVGLGVPAVENILEQHGGGLRIVSAPGEGCVMTAWFPQRALAPSAISTEVSAAVGA